MDVIAVFTIFSHFVAFSLRNGWLIFSYCCFVIIFSLWFYYDLILNDSMGNVKHWQTPEKTKQPFITAVFVYI